MGETFLQDIRHAVRQLRRTKRSAVLVIVTLGVCIAAATTVFSLLNAIVLRPLPIRDPQQVVAITLTDQHGRSNLPIDYATYAQLAEHQQIFEDLCAYSGGGILSLEARGTLIDGAAAAATPECLRLLGVRPLFGRLIEPSDAPGLAEPARVVVLGYRFWRRLFDGDPKAVGEQLKIEGTPVTIVGVLGPEFPGLHVDSGSDFHIPLTLLVRIIGNPKRPVRAMNLIGRLRPGVSLEQARAAVTVAWPALQAGARQTGPDSRNLPASEAQRVRVENAGRGFSFLRERYAAPLVSLTGLAALLLFMGCVNLSGLLLAQAATYERRVAIYLAIGASRFRIVRVLILENLLVTITSTLLAVPLAWAASSVLGTLIWDSYVPLAMAVTPDARVLATAAAVAIVTGLLISMLPARAVLRTLALSALRPATVTAPYGFMGKGLVVVQVALSLVLLFGAALFAVSLGKLRSVDTGVHTEGVLFARAWQVPGPRRTYDEQSYYPVLVERLSAIPTVRSVALSHFFPAYFNSASLPLHVIARTSATDTSGKIEGLMEFVSPRFFETLGAGILQGRDLSWADRVGSPAVAIINRTLAQQLFPDGAAIGQRIRIGTDAARQAVEVIGITSDLTVGNLRTPHLPVVFRPRLQEPQYMRVPIVLVHAGGDRQAVAAAIDSTIRSLGHEYTRRISTLEGHLDTTLLQERLLSWISALCAALAAVLAFLGLYALLTHAVANRTREIGVRMALGASPTQIIAVFLREGLSLAALGILIGVPAAVGAGRLTRALLYGVDALDPTTLVSVTAMLTALAVLAAFLPARRASSTDPSAALKWQ